MERKESKINYEKIINEFENERFYDISNEDLSMIKNLESSLLKKKASLKNNLKDDNFYENLDTKSYESKFINFNDNLSNSNKHKNIVIAEKKSYDSYEDETLLYENEERKKTNYFNVLLIGEHNPNKKQFIDYMQKKLKKNKFLEEKNDKINEYILELKHRKNKKILSLLEYKKDFTTKKLYKKLKAYILDKIITFNDLNKLIKKNRKLSFDNIIIDTRIHLCLFFINSDKMEIKEMLYFQKLGKYVNIIPVFVDNGIYTDYKKKKILIKKHLLNNNLKWFDFKEKDFNLINLREKLINKTTPIIINFEKKKSDKGDLDMLLEILISPYKNTYYYKTELICDRVMSRLREKIEEKNLEKNKNRDKKDNFTFGGVALGIGLFGVFCFIKKKIL